MFLFFFFNTFNILISRWFVEEETIISCVNSQRILGIHRLCTGSIGLLRNKWVSLDMNSVIIKDSLNPIMFILYLEARMMACEHMQQLHRASTGLESRVIVIPRFPDWRGIVMTGHARFSFFTVNTRNGATCFVIRTCDAPSCVNDQITMTRWRLESNKNRIISSCNIFLSSFSLSFYRRNLNLYENTVRYFDIPLQELLKIEGSCEKNLIMYFNRIKSSNLF